MKYPRMKDSKKEIIILDRYVKVAWHRSNREWYIALGYVFTGMKKNFLSLVDDLPPSSSAKIFVRCPLCDDDRLVVYADIIKAGHTFCVNHARVYDLTGMSFGRLVVLGFDKKKTKYSYWICRCVCGKIKSIMGQCLIKGKAVSCGCYRREAAAAMCGENSPNWNPYLTTNHRLVGRRTTEYRKWRKAVYRRDCHICMCCGKTGGRLNAHHLYSYSDYPEYQLDTDNGVTLCKVCHDDFHNNFMGGRAVPCTPEDYLLWVLTKNEIALAPPLKMV